MAEKQPIQKVLEQHAMMERFFSGGFIKAPAPPPRSTGPLQGKKTSSLGLLAKEIESCRECQLGGVRTNAVPGEGCPSARVVFVGEAPGAEEDAQGRPFVGRAGGLLDKIIGAMGLSRGDVFIANILKCRPPGNRDPRPDEIVSCLPYLHRQLETIRPDIIVALGAHAARTLLETNSPIGALRGRFHDFQTIGGRVIKLMPTYHPAYLLRNYSTENRRKLWLDMQKVMAELGLKPPKKPV